MIQLCGFTMSNYYSIVRMCLLEKDIPFEENLQDIVVKSDVAHAGDTLISTVRDEYLSKSPVGKIPCIVTSEGPLSETQIILEYLEDAYPQVPLLPQGAYARAKARELARVLDLHVELVIRRVYPEAFFGAAVAPEIKSEVRAQIIRAIEGVARLTQLSPYAVGSSFTYVDCVAAVHLTVARAALARVYDLDLNRSLPGLPSYLVRIGERPSFVIAMEAIHGALSALGLR